MIDKRLRVHDSNANSTYLPINTQTYTLHAIYFMILQLWL